MLEIKDIKKLAKLARIDLTEKEEESLLKEVGPILGYVSQIQEAVSAADEEKKAGEHRNIVRMETNPTGSGTNTDSIVSNFPEQKDNYLKVKKIL